MGLIIKFMSTILGVINMLSLEPLHTRGERSYVHGTDLYQHLFQSITKRDPIISLLMLKIHKPLLYQPKFIEGEFSNDACAIYKYKVGAVESFGSLVESSEKLRHPLFCTEKEIRHNMRYCENEECVNFYFDGSYPLINFILFGSKHLMEKAVPTGKFWFSKIICNSPQFKTHGFCKVTINSIFSKIFEIKFEIEGKELAMISGIVR